MVMPADQNMSMEYLLRVRGDTAIAALHAMQKQLHRMLDQFDVVIKELGTLDDKFQVGEEVAKTPMDRLVKTMRDLRPDLCEGKSDAEVMQLFQQGATHETRQAETR